MSSEHEVGGSSPPGGTTSLARFLVAVAQLVERQLVELNVAGSNPVGHPCLFSLCNSLSKT